nr:DUF6198 family protein [uncultured Agathobaculum sp.]
MGKVTNKTVRYLFFVIGVMINSFGVALITKAALGTSPISSVPYVLSLKFTPTLGEFTFVMNLAFIALQPILLRRDYKPIQLLQVFVNLLFSWFIDVSMNLLGWFEPQNIVVELIALLLGCAVLGFGISVEVAPDVLRVPGEGLVGALAQVTKIRFGSVKVAFDVTLVAISLTLSLIFFHGLNGLGLGTVISALIVGRFVNLFNARLPLIARIAGLAQMPETVQMPVRSAAADQKAS